MARANAVRRARVRLGALQAKTEAGPAAAVDRALERDRTAIDEPPTVSDAPQRVRALLAELPDRYARILQLRFLESCTLREAARAMNISVGNAKVLQHRALHRAAQTEGANQ